MREVYFSSLSSPVLDAAPGSDLLAFNGAGGNLTAGLFVVIEKQLIELVSASWGTSGLTWATRPHGSRF